MAFLWLFPLLLNAVQLGGFLLAPILLLHICYDM